MTKEATRTAFVTNMGEPIHVIGFTGSEDDGTEKNVFRVRMANREIRTFDNEDQALKFAEDLGGKRVENISAQVIAAEIDGTAAHQAAHAEDTVKLAKLWEERQQAQATVDEADAKAKEAQAQGKSAPKETKAQQEARERINDTPDGTPDSQATGVAEMQTGLAPTATPPVVERVPGAASGDSDKGKAKK